jgi:hypothetical protein
MTTRKEGDDAHVANQPEEVNARPVKDINKRIAAEISWSRTVDRSARTKLARQAFIRRFEDEVDPDNTLPPDERRQRAQHALRAHMLRLAKRSIRARRHIR